VFHPGNRAMYLLNEYDASIYAYSFDPRDGALSEIEVVNARPPGFDVENAQSGDLHITPDGKLVLAAVNAASQIAVFQVDPQTAKLTLARHYPVEKWPRGFNIDPHGRCLVANGLDTNSSVVYRIDPAAATLTELARIATEDAPNWVEIVRLP
jgi:6-phosphogluconolactonase